MVPKFRSEKETTEAWESFNKPLTKTLHEKAQFLTLFATKN